MDEPIHENDMAFFAQFLLRKVETKVSLVGSKKEEKKMDEDDRSTV